MLFRKGRIRLLTKGAETAVLPKCTNRDMAAVTEKHVSDCALVGLRTLVVAVRTLEAEEWREYEEQLDEASKALRDREQKVREVFEVIEDQLELIGAVAVEDKLQEDVTKTLIRLGAAGIKTWVLTGDKKETAINISYSCGHFRVGMDIIDLATGGGDPIATQNIMSEAIRRQHDERRFSAVGPDPDRWALVVDGSTLAAIFAYSDALDDFRRVTSACSAVVCCRMSPLQKSQVVRMVKTGPGAPVTAAVGDGANDVSMIQEAHVGLGIAGKEGRAAVRSADFAFAKFKHLQRVLLVHGHWYYYRVAIMVQYFFYKNVAGFTAQFFFAIFNNFSTQSLYDSLNLALFNIIYTSAPVFVYGLLEQNLSDGQLLADPALYAKIAGNALLSTREFCIWLAQAFWHSIGRS